MKIGISTANFYPDTNTEDTIEKIKKLGFSIVEIFLNSESEYEPDFIGRLKDNLEKNNIEVYSVHGFSTSFEPFLFDRYKRRREDMIKRYKSIIRAAKGLGARTYTFHGLRKTEWRNLNKDFIIDIYNNLSYEAANKGIVFSQENVSWCKSSEIDFLELLKDKMKYPVKFTFDIKQAYKAGVSPMSYLDIMGKDLVNFHINDRDENNLCLMPGRGSVDFRAIKNKLKQIGYDNVGIIEIYRDNYKNEDEFITAKKFLEGIFTNL
ncbi:MAG: sugar phosphate isomerase/epimerase [Clostridiaceae bacterium]